MVRRYGEPVEVRRGLVHGQEAPQQFLWRGRLYVVRGVFSHWLETGVWWRSASVRPVYGLDGGTPAEEDLGPDEPVSAAVSVLDDPGREVWRVEAGAGRLGRSTVVDLALDEATGHWVLVRVHD